MKPKRTAHNLRKFQRKRIKVRKKKYTEKKNIRNKFDPLTKKPLKNPVILIVNFPYAAQIKLRINRIYLKKFKGIDNYGHIWENGFFSRDKDKYDISIGKSDFGDWTDELLRLIFSSENRQSLMCEYKNHVMYEIKKEN